MATSHHSKEYYYAIQLRQQNGVSELPELEKRDDNLSDESSPLPPAALPPLARLRSEPDDQQDENEEEEPTPPPDNQTLLRLLEQHEKVAKSSTKPFSCTRIEEREPPHHLNCARSFVKMSFVSD